MSEERDYTNMKAAEERKELIEAVAGLGYIVRLMGTRLAELDDRVSDIELALLGGTSEEEEQPEPEQSNEQA